MFIGYFVIDARIIREINVKYANLKLYFYCLSEQDDQLTIMALAFSVIKRGSPFTMRNLSNTVSFQLKTVLTL